jgi:hypothetical protein
MTKVQTDFGPWFTHLTSLNISNPLCMSKVRYASKHIPTAASLMVLTELYMYYRAGRGKTEYAEEL